MSHRDVAGQLLARLGQMESLQVALADGVRLACEATGAPAGAVVVDTDPRCATDFWFQHDPHSLLEPVAADEGILDASTPALHAREGLNNCRRAALGAVRVPLRCAGRDVGQLILLMPREVGDEQFGKRIAGLEALLALLMVAVEGSAAKPLSSVLNGAGFRARVASELARSERCGDQFSVLHMKLAVASSASDGKLATLWATAASLGEALAARLRASDVVGLLAPAHLAVLLTGAGRLGARIAARRIEQLLRTPENDFRDLLERCSPPPVFCVRTFPDDGADVDRLCRVHRWNGEATVTGTTAVSSI